MRNRLFKKFILNKLKSGNKYLILRQIKVSVRIIGRADNYSFQQRCEKIIDKSN